MAIPEYHLVLTWKQINSNQKCLRVLDKGREVSNKNVIAYFLQIKYQVSICVLFF